jgi:hypothetical protein
MLPKQNMAKTPPEIGRRVEAKIMGHFAVA